MNGPSWCTTPMRASSAGPSSAVPRPSVTHSPDVGSWSPVTCRSSVVLPLPFRPTSPTMDPRGTASVTRCSATVAPKRRVTSLSSNAFTPLLLLGGHAAQHLTEHLGGLFGVEPELTHRGRDRREQLAQPLQLLRAQLLARERPHDGRQPGPPHQHPLLLQQRVRLAHRHGVDPELRGQRARGRHLLPRCEQPARDVEPDLIHQLPVDGDPAVRVHDDQHAALTSISPPPRPRRSSARSTQPSSRALRARTSPRSCRTRRSAPSAHAGTGG